MFTLFKKELNSFFSSLTGYIIIVVFLIFNGLFLWIFPGENNIIENNYASLSPLFNIAPWIFLFLIPALTMRMFSDEKQSGTIEILFTKPISDMQIITAKYLAGISLAIFSILPTLIYFISVYYLSNPVGNLDIGGFWGSFIGLIFLSAVYVAVGIFASSTTKNPIISFILAMMLSFFLYIGFDSIGYFKIFQGIENFIISLGISDHYRSISRGVIDSRDVLYFFSTIIIFLGLTKIVLDSRKW